MDKLSKFHRQQGTPLVRPPAIDKQPIDLYLLKRAVDTRGSFTAVCSNKQWAEIGRELGFGGTKNVTSVPSSLKNAYQKYLQPYETYLEKAKPDFLREMGLTPSPQQERKMDAKTSPGGMRRVLLSEFQNPDGTSADERMSEVDDVKPSVKSETPEALEEMKDVTPTPSQNGLKRPFEEMRTTRSASTSTENDKEDQPTRRESKRIKAGEFPKIRQCLIEATAPTVVGSNMAQHAHSNKPSRMGGMHSMHSSAAKKPGENCEVCGRGDNALSMLLCDGCDTGYHTFCLDPPLKSIPKYDWFCAQCLVGTNEFGFEDGDEYSLSQFRHKADSFRQEYIEKNFTPEARVRGVVTENQVEEEFWRMVSNIEETVEVDYGADIHSTTHGSGFPTVETHPTDPYSTDPWNLNILPLDNQSLFRHIKSDVSGMTVPWLYVGMMFSTFCWHNEDHYCYSINYQHFGATKTWYGIPGSDSEKFEQAMRNAVPELFETQPDLLFQLVTMLSPGRLVEEGVNVYAVDQRPNQFVITFPQAYHAGFNHGVPSKYVLTLINSST
jgi:histone demethylase JARID1